MKDISIFKSLGDRNPAKQPLVYIYSETVSTTNSVYRKTVGSLLARQAGDVQRAKALKQSTGAFTPAVVCEGGHNQSDIVALTQMVNVDIDHIGDDVLPSIINKVWDDRYNRFSYLTNSQHGIRVISSWVAVTKDGEVIGEDYFVWDSDKETQEQFLKRVLPYHRAAYAKVNEYYKGLTGLDYDHQTSDATRLSFLSHDASANYNDASESFEITPEDVAKFINKDKALVRHTDMGNVRMARTPGLSSKVNNVFDLVELWVSRTTTYQPGSFNRYVMKCGYLLCEFGVLQSIAEEWAVGNFSDYNAKDVRAIIRSCYGHANFGTKTFINY